MVYIFFCDECESLYREAMATVIQTSDRVYKNGASYTEFVSEATGPTIYEYEYDENGQAIYKEYKKIYKEYKAVLEPIEDEEMVPLEERHKINSWDDDDTGWQFSKPQLAGNKIGGQTLLMRSLTNMPEASNSEEWLLLLQLAPKQGYWNKSPDGVSPNFYPFHMYLRDTGILTVFISSDYKQTRCYIQEP